MLAWRQRAAGPAWRGPHARHVLETLAALLTRACCGAVTGNLKGYDQLLNLVLDDTLEYLRGACALCGRAYGSGANAIPRLPAQTRRTRCA